MMLSFSMNAHPHPPTHTDIERLVLAFCWDKASLAHEVHGKRGCSAPNGADPTVKYAVVSAAPSGTGVVLCGVGQLHRAPLPNRRGKAVEEPEVHGM